MNCNEMNAMLPEMLFDAEVAEANGEAQVHLARCADCRKQLDELRATMALLDTWEAPEPNPYFMTRLGARLEEERTAAPAGWFERIRARFVYSSRMTMRPVAAMAMTAVLLLGGGAYLGLDNWETPKPQPVQAAVVHDLQTLDSNAQLLDQLEAITDQPDDPNGDDDPGQS